MLLSLRPLISRSFQQITTVRPLLQASFTTSLGRMAQEYKLKGLSSLDLKGEEKKEFEVEGIDDAKILLVNLKGEIHAMTSKCSHYGAPLVKGVVTSEGTITCPWHGACFSIATGDVEDAPALDPMAKFRVFEKDGGVYIEGEEATIKASKRTLDIACKAQGSDKVVVIGGGSGAVGAIEGLRAGGFKGPITVLCRETTQPFDRTKLSKALIGDLSKVAWRSEEFYKKASIDILEEEATSVDFDKKTVSTKSGKEYPYTKLILAPGASPKSLPLDGLKKGDLNNVFLLRSLVHTQAINEALGDGEKDPKKVVVIGSSFIGMEVANCMASKKHNVTVVGMESAPTEAVFGAKVGNIFKGLLEKNGVKFVMDAKVSHATPSSSKKDYVGAVHLKGGQVLEADVVILGVGVAPATEFLKENKSVKLEDDGSIKVDERFAVAGLDGVFAIGDIATYPYKGSMVRIEHWDVAQNAGRAVARTIAQPSLKPKTFIPVFWSALGSQLRYCGNASPAAGGYDDVIIKGETNPEKPSFAAFYTKDNEVVAVASMQMDPVMTQCAELMRHGKMFSKKDIVAGKDVLSANL